LTAETTEKQSEGVCYSSGSCTINCSTCIQLLFVTNIWKASRNYADTMNQKTKLESNFTVYIKISALLIVWGTHMQADYRYRYTHSDTNPSAWRRTMRKSGNVDWDKIWDRNECEKLARNPVIQLNWQLKGYSRVVCAVLLGAGPSAPSARQLTIVSILIL